MTGMAHNRVITLVIFSGWKRYYEHLAEKIKDSLAKPSSGHPLLLRQVEPPHQPLDRHTQTRAGIGFHCECSEVRLI
jgi:hypothetical protein